MYCKYKKNSMEKKQFIAVHFFFYICFLYDIFFLNCHLLFEQQFDIMKIKLSTYVFLFKKFVDYGFNQKYQKLYKQSFIMFQLIKDFWMFFSRIPCFCYWIIKYSDSLYKTFHEKRNCPLNSNSTINHLWRDVIKRPALNRSQIELQCSNICKWWNES